MVFTGTYKCDGCGAELDDLDIYEVFVSIKPPARLWHEDEDAHRWPGMPMPIYQGDADLCQKCYSAKCDGIENLVGPNQLRFFGDKKHLYRMKA